VSLFEQNILSCPDKYKIGPRKRVHEIFVRLPKKKVNAQDLRKAAISKKMSLNKKKSMYNQIILQKIEIMIISSSAAKKKQNLAFQLHFQNLTFIYQKKRRKSLACDHNAEKKICTIFTI